MLRVVGRLDPGRLQHVCYDLTFRIHEEWPVHLVTELRSDEILLEARARIRSG